jgi:hypothetical protein
MAFDITTVSFPVAYQNHKFREPTGRRLYKKLFWEMTNSGEDKSKVLYTLKDQPHEGFPSLYQLYLAEADPTEYVFATKYFDSYDHWKTLSTKTWIKELVARWREELDVSIRAGALKRIISESKSNSKSAFMANKYLLEKGWSKNEKGRPSKEAVQAAIKEEAQKSQVLEQDFLRVVGDSSGN